MVRPQVCLDNDTENRSASHPYLAGNFAPVQGTFALTSCSYEGTIPAELAGGQYVRNGGNTIFNEELGRDYHWFDGDGMLSGVLFKRSNEAPGNIEPHFVNQFILTDLYLSAMTSPTIRSHIVPSIATLVNPATTFIQMCMVILRTLFIVILSHLPGSVHGIKRISVTNTGLFYHDGRALATCESGPPIRVQLPDFETVGWYNGDFAEGEKEGAREPRGFGASGLLGFMNEWTTGHPKVDPRTGELISYHCGFTTPYVHYSITPSTSDDLPSRSTSKALQRAPIPGVSGAKMMHDFGVSYEHTVIMDLPLTLDPYNIVRRKPVIDYDSTKPTRFGVFPRYEPASIRWYETGACCIFHTANTWDETSSDGTSAAINFLACRLTTPATLFVAGNVEMSKVEAATEIDEGPRRPPFFDSYDHDDAFVQTKSGKVETLESLVDGDDCVYDRSSAIESRRQKAEMTPKYVVPEEEQCRLYYYRFDLAAIGASNHITHQFALSSIPFEFPSVHPGKEMTDAQYVYGCSTSTSSFNMALGKSAKIDTLVKIDALSLIAQGKQDPYITARDCVDSRTVGEIVRDNFTNPNDLIKCFKMPKGWYAQEARLIPRTNAKSEDDGYLLFYAFDESQFDERGYCKSDAVSELWILDATNMTDIVCRIYLPQRVPYGFHGMFFTEQQIARQRPVSSYRTPKTKATSLCTRVHDFLLRIIA